VAKPFDSSMKMLVEEFPADWVEWLGYGRPPAEVIDADLATVSAATDKVVRVGRGSNRWLLLVEMLASDKAHIPERTHFHSTLLASRHGLPVRSVLVLLRPEADGPAMTGVYERACPGDAAYLTFRYRTVRLWQVPAAELLRGGPGLLPLAPVADVARADLPAVVHQVKRRVEREAPEAKASEILAATYVLMGLRYDTAVISALKREVLRMEESITYQEIVGIGQLREARKFILLQGKKRFGRTSRKAAQALEGITDLEKLEELGQRLLDVKSWDELLAER
jgi:predicted transposase YdaD